MQQPLSSLPHIRFSVDKFYDRNSRNAQEKGSPFVGSSIRSSPAQARWCADLDPVRAPVRMRVPGRGASPGPWRGTQAGCRWGWARSSGACAVARKRPRVERCWSKQLGRRDGALRSLAWACPRGTGGSTRRREDQDTVSGPDLSQGVPAPSQTPAATASFPVPGSLRPRSALVPTQPSTGPNVWRILHSGKLLAGCPFSTLLPWRRNSSGNAA